MFPNALQDLNKSGISIDPSQLDVSKPVREIESICARIDILCLDPTPDLKSLGRDAFLPTDDHYSIAGHEQIARKLGRVMPR